jgi:branched-chain amino acid transport system permease protein
MLDGKLAFAGFRIEKVQLLVIVAAVVMMAGLYFYVERTRAGRAMRAVSEDQEMARLMGIDVDRAIARVFIVGGALAGAAGMLFGLVFESVQLRTGFLPGIKAFTAAVLGGIGNIPGAMLGGIFLGEVETIGPLLFLTGLGVPSPNQIKDVVAFTMLVLVLVFRPSGILGERVARQRA